LGPADENVHSECCSCCFDLRDARRERDALRAESDVLGGHMECAKLEQERLRRDLDAARAEVERLRAYDLQWAEALQSANEGRKRAEAEVERLQGDVGEEFLRAERAEANVVRLVRAFCTCGGTSVHRHDCPITIELDRETP
jgi:hypothetical protein